VLCIIQYNMFLSVTQKKPYNNQLHPLRLCWFACRLNHLTGSRLFARKESSDYSYPDEAVLEVRLDKIEQEDD
jgi:hypothetical protein